jgi:hypothetical protein
VLLSVIFVFTKCKGDKQKTGVNYITPKELPAIVPGFHFPEDSNVIYGWMNNPKFPNNYDSASVYNHAWGIWAGLTANSGEVYQGDSLLIFETWLGITDIQVLIDSNNSKGGCAATKQKKTRTLLAHPNQFGHGPSATLLRTLTLNTKGNGPIENPVTEWVTVSYDPNAACYATTNSILRQSVQNKYAVDNGIGNIPPFPNKAITIKPVYLVASDTDNLVRIPVWSGPKAEAYPASNWPTVVYADIKNRQAPNKKLVPAAKSDTNPADIAAATCNLSDFINFKVDSLMAAYMNAADSTEDGSGFATAGSIAILVGMHVTTKEIANWTWQSYYWAPDPANPLDPSSALAASLRPAQLQGAASHYAVIAGYAMVLPNQPLTGGTNTGVIPVYSYNPYLESGFDSTFNNGNLVFPNGKNPLNPAFIYGSQTNCMSCHTLASPQSIMTKNGVTNDIYSTVQYISNNDSFFINKVRLDFAWSIQGNTIKDAPIKPIPK